MTLDIEQIKDRFGYYFHPAAYPHSPGHPTLDVFMRAQPTRQHYDPESLALRVRQPDPYWQYRIATLTLNHPWRFQSECVVAPGRIVISDRRNKVLESFTFGGRLTVLKQEELTHCRIESPAPILELIDPPSLPAMLAVEVQVMLAEIRAKSVGRLQIYERKLASVDPDELYRSALVALKARLADFDHQECDPCATLCNFINAEIEALEGLGRWVRSPRRLEALLLPPATLP